MTIFFEGVQRNMLCISSCLLSQVPYYRGSDVQFTLSAAVRDWNTIKIRLLRLIINAPYGTNFATILDFSISQMKKNCLFREVILAVSTFFNGLCRCREI